MHFIKGDQGEEHNNYDKIRPYSTKRCDMESYDFTWLPVRYYINTY